MNEEIFDKKIKILAVFAFILGVIALASLIYPSMLSGLTGHVTGEANLTIVSETNINTTSAVEWGEGRIDVDQSKAQLNTSQGTVSNGNWTAVATGLLIQNNGNTNLSLLIKSGDGDAATFIGGTSPLYEWNVSNYEADSCGDFGAWTGFEFSTINTTAAGNGNVVCDAFDYIETADVIEIDFSVVIPDDATTGIKSDTITITAVAV